MSLSKALLGWKGNLTTLMPADYVLALRMDVNAFSDAAKELELENAELRELVRDLRACNGSCQRCLELMGKCEYEGRMSELGIEASNA